MTKEESKIMQGVAILLMMYLHLFNQMTNVDLCQNFLYIGAIPFVNFFSRATNPVPFFLLLSGYGLYIVEHQRKDYNILRKIKNLYIHYWISIIIFVTLGAYFVGTDKYPGSCERIIANITAWHTTWNGEVWFFFPYMLLALSSKWLFKLMDNVNVWLYMMGALFLSTSAAFCISRYGNAYFYHHQLPYMPILYLDCLFAFVSGAWLAKKNVIKKFSSKYESLKIKRYWLWVLWILLIVLRCCFKTGAFHTFYAIVFVVLFANVPRWKWLNHFLKEMGRRSTSIWFVHTYFCYYIFHDFIYSFRYPVLIYLVLLACSYVSAVVIDYFLSIAHVYASHKIDS